MAPHDPLDDPLDDGPPGVGSPPEDAGPKREPIAPGKRKRLQQAFERANQLMIQENWDYANELFTACVTGDPENSIYLQSFLANLKKKYNNNKKGSKAAFITGAGTRRAVTKAAGQEDWDGVIKTGVEALKLNPWDTATLTSMANAVREMGYDEVELAYLKTALEANASDPDVNRLCAQALERRKRFDEAIICWHRVEQAKPGDEEAAKEIARLAVEKTIDHGGYEETDPSKKKMPGKQPQAEAAAPDQPATPGLTPLQRLEREIAKNPKDLVKYHELAELYASDNRFDKAEAVLAKAVEVSEGDTDIRERYEDARIRRLRHEVALADQKWKDSGSDEDRQRWRVARKKLNDVEIEVFEARTKRYPNKLGFNFDLAERYKLAGRYKEAIPQYQQARNDSRRRGMCMLALGQCFEKINQKQMAMSSYESAVGEIPTHDEEHHRLALYLAGKLALERKDGEKAEKHLTTLAELDFTYKDVSTLLEKVAELRDAEA